MPVADASRGLSVGVPSYEEEVSGAVLTGEISIRARHAVNKSRSGRIIYMKFKVICDKS
jgi:hypothetical protein